MKKPPDEMYIGDEQKESPLWKWFNLGVWALENDDFYIYQRATEMINKLKNY